MLEKPKKKKKKRIVVLDETYQAVFERDNGCCVLCGKGGWVELHHIIFRSHSKDKINDIKNCVIICKNCHIKVHNEGKKYKKILLDMMEEDNERNMERY